LDELLSCWGNDKAAAGACENIWVNTIKKRASLFVAADGGQIFEYLWLFAPRLHDELSGAAVELLECVEGRNAWPGEAKKVISYAEHRDAGVRAKAVLLIDEKVEANLEGATRICV
jgi:hypothetical protein